MKLIIAGSRKINNYQLLEDIIKLSPFHGKISKVVSGRARGVDRLGEEYARLHNIPIIPFPAPWKEKGLAAGPIRNRQMGEFVRDNPPGGCIILRVPNSKGSQNMMEVCKELGLPLFDVMWNERGYDLDVDFVYHLENLDELQER